MANKDALGILVTREASTEALYAKRVAMLTRRASEIFGEPAGLFDTIDAFALCHEQFAASTIRQYSAALAWAIDRAEEECTLDDHQIAACRKQLTHTPVRRPRGAEPRTSAKKRRAVLPTELHLVCEKLRLRGRADDKLLLRMLINNISFGLRPCEYQGAQVTEIVLVVQSAKSTNGRGKRTRDYELAEMSRGQIESLKILVRDLEDAANGNISGLIDRLGSRLRRACKSLGIVPFSLYSTRHQAIANKKRIVARMDRVNRPVIR